jgi:predicted transcriptional regulator
METSEPPHDVQILLRDHIESYEQLELLLLIRADSGACWTAETLSTRLHIPASLLQAALDGLESAGFLQVQQQSGAKRHAYLCQSDTVEATIDRLAAAYRENPIPIIKLMSANAIERLRTSALRTFADAFILKKDKDRG